MLEEEGILPLPSLMEAWRPPTGGKRTLRGAYVRIGRGAPGRGGQGRPEPLSQAEARAKLERIVRKAPEVMVKVSGKQYGAHHLSEHFGYVARHGKLAVRSSEGEIIDDPKRLKEIAQDWAMLDEASERKVMGGLRDSNVKLEDTEWTAGDHLWLIELIAPFATVENRHAELMIADLVTGPFSKRSFKMLNTKLNSSDQQVVEMPADAGERLVKQTLAMAGATNTCQ